MRCGQQSKSSGVHVRDHGCVKGRWIPEGNAKASVRDVSGTCTPPGWTKVCVCNDSSTLRKEIYCDHTCPNREVEASNLRTTWSELPALWSDISNAMRGFKDHSLHMLVLDEVLKMELFIFRIQFKLKPGNYDDHRVIVGISNDLWFRGMEIKEEGENRQNAKEMKALLEAMVLRIKPEAIK